ncbi:MAG: hypothetical protein OEW20_08675 [Nitrospira sp.]|nr:hypothetical protein [Nitrospira sp.]
MDGRVHDLSMIALRQQRLVIIFLMILAGGLLCSELTADAKSDYDIINTGVNGGGCWYDESHFIVVKGQQPAPGQEFEVEGLYYLDPNYPKDLKRIDLSPLEPSLQRHIRDVTCQGQTVLFHILTADKKRNTVYFINIGQSPRVVVAKQEGFILPQSVNVRERYVLGVTNGISEPHSPNAEQAVKDCNFSNLMDGYRVFCLRHDRGTKRTWPVNNGFVAQYIWEETIRMNKNGQYQWVPNQEPPLKLPDGTALKQGYLLRNLENQVLAKVKMEQPPYAIYRNTFIVNPQGNALYAACSKVGDHGTRRLTVGGRVCRFPMDGVNYQWTEAAAMQQSPQDPISLQQLNTNERGDIVATELAHRGVTSIWKYTAATRQVGKVYQASSLTDLGGPQLSPTGQWISFSERQILYLARAKGVQP